MGPESAKTFKGRHIVAPPTDERRLRVPQEVDYGRRGKGYIFGAFMPHDGQAMTEPYPQRTAANWADFRTCRMDHLDFQTCAL